MKKINYKINEQLICCNYIDYYLFNIKEQKILFNCPHLLQFHNNLESLLAYAVFCICFC